MQYKQGFSLNTALILFQTVKPHVLIIHRSRQKEVYILLYTGIMS
jgi:hypothetical protein